jgi:hypothetical protein
MRLKGALMIRKALSKYCNDTRQRHDDLGLDFQND